MIYAHPEPRPPFRQLRIRQIVAGRGKSILQRVAGERVLVVFHGNTSGDNKSWITPIKRAGASVLLTRRLAAAPDGINRLAARVFAAGRNNGYRGT